MTKKELFEKYRINKTHNAWDDQIDNWESIEIYRIMHNGELPSSDDHSVKWITDFLDKTNDIEFMKELMKRRGWGSLYLTAKRMVYKLSDQILKS
ncbi:MAG: hypothetical protein M0P47_09360 [Bacteroidales bacterium]|nr:hypothetical protein [Bacteroidales bacterium]